MIFNRYIHVYPHTHMYVYTYVYIDAYSHKYVCITLVSQLTDNYQNFIIIYFIKSIFKRFYLY